MKQVNDNDSKIIKSVCSICALRCGIDVHVKNERIVRVTGMPEHPINKICIKGEAIPEWIAAKGRLTSPLVKNGHQFREISWDKAFEIIANKLTAIKEQYGANAVVTNLGVPFTRSETEYVMRRFCDLFETINYTSGSSFCYAARTIAHRLTFGDRAITQRLSTARAKCVILWGSNPAESIDPYPVEYIYEDVNHGAKLIVVDPKATAPAKRAHLHAQIRPGTDCALALGILHIIIAEKWYDEHFVKEWTIGFDKLINHVKGYPPEKIEQITWVPQKTIREIAKIYAESKPAHIVLGISLDHSTNGIQSSRAIASLIAVTGNLDVPGGQVFTPAPRLTNLRVEQGLKDNSLGVGAKYPIYTEMVREQTVSPAIDQMITGHPYPIKAFLIHSSNAALTWPNANKFRKARENLDLLVVIDIFMTDTARMADIILPGTIFLERTTINQHTGRGHSLITLGNRAVKPFGHAKEDWSIWAGIGQKLGLAEYFPWENSEELVAYLLKGSNITLDQLRQNPGGYVYVEREYRKYEKSGFNTPSKKVEFYSCDLEKYGYDPLPTFHEPAESPISRPDLAKQYPLLFVGGPRRYNYFHSQFRNIPSLRSRLPEPLLEMNPETAKALGIRRGDMVRVESSRGTITVKAKMTGDVHPEVVTMEHGWSEANANLLTSDEARDPISGYPAFRQVLCRVNRVS